MFIQIAIDTRTTSFLGTKGVFFSRFSFCESPTSFLEAFKNITSAPHDAHQEAAPETPKSPTPIALAGLQ